MFHLNGVCIKVGKKKRKRGKKTVAKKKKVSFLLKAIKGRIGAIIQEEAGREGATQSSLSGGTAQPLNISHLICFPVDV